MGRLRLATGIVSLGLAASLVGFYLLLGLAWVFVIVGAELVAIGMTMANMGAES